MSDMTCEHPWIAIQPDLLADGKGSRPVALCLNPDCELHTMTLRIVDQAFLEDIKTVTDREWRRYLESRES